MDQALQPPEDDDALGILLQRAEQFILQLFGLIDTVFDRLGRAPMSAALVRYLTRRALVPAEATLRRAILLIAATLPAPALKPRAVRSNGKPSSGASARKQDATERVPIFRMTEPQPRPRKNPKTDYLPEHMMPRITLLVDSVLSARSSAPPASALRDPAATFMGRLAALQVAFDDPVSAARRWLRRCAASAKMASRALAPHKIPGARKSLGNGNLDLLRELTTAARRTLAVDSS